MKRLDEMQVLGILSDPGLESKLYEELTQALEKIRLQSRNMEELEMEVISASSIRSCAMKEIPSTGSAQATNAGLMTVLENGQKLQREYLLSLREQVCVITEQIETVQRVGLAYQTLIPEYRYILAGLYIENYKWSYMESVMGISHRTLLKKRKEAIKDLLDRYHSSYSLRELGKMKNSDIFHPKPKAKKEKEGDLDDGQMSLSDFWRI